MASVDNDPSPVGRRIYYSYGKFCSSASYLYVILIDKRFE